MIIRHKSSPNKVGLSGGWWLGDARGASSTLRYDMAEHFHDSIVCVEISLRFQEVRPANHRTTVRRSVRGKSCGDVADTHSRTLASEGNGKRRDGGDRGGDETYVDVGRERAVRVHTTGLLDRS